MLDELARVQAVIPDIQMTLAREAANPLAIFPHALGHEPVDRVVQAPLDEQHLAGVELGRPLGDEAPEHAAKK